MKPHGRRLAFTDVLMRVLPESRKAPMVLFQLVPLAIQIVTAVAFGDAMRRRNCGSGRNRSCPPSPTVTLATAPCWTTADLCDVCSNPMWAYKWLTAAD